MFYSKWKFLKSSLNLKKKHYKLLINKNDVIHINQVESSGPCMSWLLFELQLL